MTNEQWLDRYYPIYAKICTHGGHVYAGISTPVIETLYWNRTLFREAGLDPDRPPATLAEFNDYARRLTKHDPKTGRLTQVGFLPQDPGWWPWIFCDWFGGGPPSTTATEVHLRHQPRQCRGLRLDPALHEGLRPRECEAVLLGVRPLGLALCAVLLGQDRHGFPGLLLRQLHQPV